MKVSQNFSEPDADQTKREGEPAEESRSSDNCSGSSYWRDVNAHVQPGVSQENKATTEGSLYEDVHLVFH